MPRAKQETEAVDENIKSGEPLPIAELGVKGSAPIEKVSESDFVEAAELEKFMSEVLTVRIYPTPDKNAVQFPTPSCNGVNQPFIRGKVQKVRRKYVEILARTRTTGYTQMVPDSSRPEHILMIPSDALVYPFEVLHDPNPTGPAWLKAILDQPT